MVNNCTNLGMSVDFKSRGGESGAGSWIERGILIDYVHAKRIISVGLAVEFVAEPIDVYWSALVIFNLVHCDDVHKNVGSLLTLFCWTSERPFLLALIYANLANA